MGEWHQSTLKQTWRFSRREAVRYVNATCAATHIQLGPGSSQHWLRLVTSPIGQTGNWTSHNQSFGRRPLSRPSWPSPGGRGGSSAPRLAPWASSAGAESQRTCQRRSAASYSAPSSADAGVESCRGATREGKGAWVEVLHQTKFGPYCIIVLRLHCQPEKQIVVGKTELKA